MKKKRSVCGKSARQAEFIPHLAIQYLCMKGRDTHSPDPESPLEGKKKSSLMDIILEEK